MKKEIENGEVLRRRELLKTELNKNKVQIDRTIFVKTEEEKNFIKSVKKDSKQVNNQLRSEFVQKIINANPNWNIIAYV